MRDCIRPNRPSPVESLQSGITVAVLVVYVFLAVLVLLF